MVLVFVKTNIVTYSFFHYTTKEILQGSYQNRVKQNKQVPPFLADNKLARRLLYFKRMINFLISNWRKLCGN